MSRKKVRVELDIPDEYKEGLVEYQRFTVRFMVGLMALIFGLCSIPFVVIAGVVIWRRFVSH